MADAYEVRKRLLALEQTDIRHISEFPLGISWAKRANVNRNDLARGAQRAVMGLRAAMMRDAQRFAADLATMWENLIAKQLETIRDEPDPTRFGVRLAAVLIGTTGARALVAALASADCAVSAEMVERFAELSDAAEQPLLDAELEPLNSAMLEHLPHDVRPGYSGTTFSSSTEEPSDSTRAATDLDSIGSSELIATLRGEANRLASLLSTTAGDVLAGRAIADIHDGLTTWNDQVSEVWRALGGRADSAETSFAAMDALHSQLVERESAAAESVREEKLAKLTQLRRTVAGLEPLVDADETFLTAYQVACERIVALEDELGAGTDGVANRASALPADHGDGSSTEPVSDDSGGISTQQATAGTFEVSDGVEPSAEVGPAGGETDPSQPPDRWIPHPTTTDTPNLDAEPQQSPPIPALPETEHSAADDSQTGSPRETPDTAVDSGSAVGGGQVSNYGSWPGSSANTNSGDESARFEGAGELAHHVNAGRFGAAWLVASAAGLSEQEVKAYRHAAAAFHCGPGGIDPAEVLVSLTANVSEGEELSCQPSRVALAATMRAALAAGWSPRSELEVMASHANLDAAGRNLVNAVIAAGDRNYQHLQDVGGHASLSLDVVHEKALGIRTELEGMRINFTRADKILKYLLRAGEPLGAALGAVLADTSGVERREALTAVLAVLESPDDVIGAADTVVSSPQQRRKPIESHARKRLRRAVDAAAECVAEALNFAVVVADDSRTVVTQEVRSAVVAAARAVTLDAGTPAAEPGDAALRRLSRWIIEPEPPSRFSSELDLLLDETLPAVSAGRDHEGLPIIDRDCATAVITELRSPGSWGALFDSYVTRGDLQEADAVARHDPELQERMPTARTDWKRRLDREVSTVRAELARTYADGALHGAQADHQQVDAEARLVAPGEYSGDRYDLQMSELRRLRDELAEQRGKSAAHLCGRANDEISDASDRARIAALISDEDFVGANELLALARSGALPPLTADQGSVGSELFDAFSEAVFTLAGSTTPSVQDLVAIFAEGRLDDVAKSDQARLASWGELVPRRGYSRSRSGALFAVLRSLGLDTRGEPVRQTPPGVRHFDLFRVNAAPVDGSLVPGLGSQATHYMVAVTADDKLLRETLSSGFPAKNGPNIVLFDGLLTMDQRRQCLSVCREKRISAIVVDHAVAAFVAARYPRSLRAVQQLTLPFTCFTHYTVVAGNVPDEVFVGRNDELTQLSDRTGSLFVYGGRQLGKSALLRKIQREFNQVPDQHAIFIDLNSHGIGTWADPQQLWPVLHSELAKIGSMGIKASSSVRNHDVVIKAIRHWLDGKESRRLLLLLDEADSFLEKESRGAPSGFRNIGPLKGLFDDTEGRFKPVFAGLHKVQRLQNIANTPLAHGGRDVLIGPLAAKPARDLVLKPLEALGYRFENPEAVWRLLAFTNLQPGLIQVVCNDLVAHLQSRPLRKGEPLIAISDTDVDSVTGNENTRNKIAEKLRLTIALEDRYRVIALAVAIMSMEDDFREKYVAADIREHCEVYWPPGFEDLNSAEFEVYLDELVGLGVLTRDRENYFAVRSPNIVTMLGSKEQLETELEENREQFELPHEYNPRSTRRQITTDGGTVRSPLSEHDLSRLVPVQKKYPPRDFVVIGGNALGVSNVAPVLTMVAAERGVQVTVFDGAGEGIASALSEFKWAGGGASSPRLVVVDGSRADASTAAAIIDAADLVRKRGHGHLVMVLGPTGAGTVRTHRQRWSSTGTSLITLEKWSGDGIRSWRDNPFNTPTDRQDLLHHSGGWPELVERAVVDVSNRGVSYAEEWERLARYPENSETAEAFLRDVGIGETELTLLSTWGQLGSATHERVEDIAAVLDRHIDEVRSIAEDLTLLGALNEHQGEFLIDPVVVRAVTASA